MQESGARMHSLDGIAATTEKNNTEKARADCENSMRHIGLLKREYEAK